MNIRVRAPVAGVSVVRDVRGVEVGNGDFAKAEGQTLSELGAAFGCPRWDAESDEHYRAILLCGIVGRSATTTTFASPRYCGDRNIPRGKRFPYDNSLVLCHPASVPEGALVFDVAPRHLEIGDVVTATDLGDIERVAPLTELFSERVVEAMNKLPMTWEDYRTSYEIRLPRRVFHRARVEHADIVDIADVTIVRLARAIFRVRNRAAIYQHAEIVADPADATQINEQLCGRGRLRRVERKMWKRAKALREDAFQEARAIYEQSRSAFR